MCLGCGDLFDFQCGFNMSFCIDGDMTLSMDSNLIFQCGCEYDPSCRDVNDF